MRKQSILTRMLAVVLATSFLAAESLAAVRNPELPDPGKAPLSKEEQEKLGEQAAAEVYKQMPVLPDNSAETQYVRQLGERLVSQIPRQYSWPFRFHVIPEKEINAFALPGGRIVLSGKLIEVAKTPEEVAGVLAHELGHVKNRDPEAAVVRLTGMQVLISLATGSDGGTVLSNIAGLAALLRYTRSAEVKADSYALDLLNKGRIDPLGLKRFFESIKVLEEARRPRIGPLGSIIATHPATEERIARIKPLENGPALPVMSDSQWQALKRICK